MRDVKRQTNIVSEGAGELDIVDAYGEVLGKFRVPAGVHKASVWLDLLEPGQSLQISDGCFALPPRRGACVASHPLALQSDANPDFKPTSATRLEREMRIELNEMRSLRLAVQKEARIKQAQAIEVVETIPEAKPVVKAPDAPEGEAQG